MVNCFLNLNAQLLCIIILLFSIINLFVVSSHDRLVTQDHISFITTILSHTTCLILTISTLLLPHFGSQRQIRNELASNPFATLVHSEVTRGSQKASKVSCERPKSWFYFTKHKTSNLVDRIVRCSFLHEQFIIEEKLHRSPCKSTKCSSHY